MTVERSTASKHHASLSKSHAVAKSKLQSHAKVNSKFLSRATTSWTVNSAEWLDSYLNYKGQESSWTQFGTHGIVTPQFGWNVAQLKGIAYSTTVCGWDLYKPVTVKWGDYCYFPFRTMNQDIKYSDDGNNHAYTTSTKLGYIAFYLKGWGEDSAMSLINEWNTNRNRRLSVLATAITDFGTNAQTYVDNLNLSTTAATSAINYTTEIASTTTQIAAYQTKIDAANAAATSANTQKATITTTKQNLIVSQDAVKAKMTTNYAQVAEKEAIVKQLNGEDTEVSNTKAGFTAQSDEQLASFNTEIATLKTLIPDQVENLTSAASKLTSGDLEGCLAILRAIHPI